MPACATPSMPRSPRSTARPACPRRSSRCHALLEAQAYRLAYWRVASSEINYRRFFDINELAGLRMERGEVFEATHRLLLRLIAEGKVQGVRLDHIDGLYDPRGYCQRLLSRVADVLGDGQAGERPEVDPRNGRPIYLLVEKILARHESLREDLPVAGTTGYEFINLVNGLFVDPAAERALTATYLRFIDREADFDASWCSPPSSRSCATRSTASSTSSATSSTASRSRAGPPATSR